MEQNMFCYQCQETAGCTGCTKMGVCGKTPHVAALQDLLVWVTKGLSAVTTQMRREDLNVTGEINQLITKNLFTTITNANFDPEMITSQIEKTLQIKKVLLLQLKNPEKLPEAARWSAAPSEFAAKAATVGVLSAKDEDIRSLRELITYGLKGLSAYSRHANVLLKEDKELDTFLQRALAATLDDTLTVEDLVNLTLETGKYGVSGMALLDQANTEAYGNPEITKVNIGVGKNPGILISGHDLKDLEIPDPTPTPDPKLTQTPEQIENKEKQLLATVQGVNLNILRILPAGSDTSFNLDMSAIPAYFKGGIAPGSHVNVTYIGDLETTSLEEVRIIAVTGEDPDTINDKHISFTVTGTIIGSTANTITVQTDDGAIDTFRTENAQDLTAGGMEYGDYVCVTFHPSKSKSSNIYTAIKVQDA